MSEILSLKGLIFISNTFNLWNKSSRKFPNSISFLISLLEEQINLTSTLTSLLPFTLLNFWSVKTRKIFDWIANGISDTWSTKRVPLLAFSKAPYEIDPSFFSSPNNSSSYLSLSNRAPFIITKDSFFLFDFLWIFLAINSFPDPEGPLIKILLSVREIFSIWSLIFEIFLLIAASTNILLS